MASYNADLKCPICSRMLEESEYRNASKQLENTLSKRFQELSRKIKQEYDSKISELKLDHRKDMQATAKKYELERKAQKKRLEEQTRKSKEIRERELREAKKNYQTQLENIRTVYQNQMEDLKRVYDQMISNNQVQIDKLQKWLHEELVDDPFTKIAKIEQEKTSVEKQVADLVQQLNGRNSELLFLQEKVKQLEERVPAEMKEQFVEEPKMDSKYQRSPDEPHDMEQKEWLEMIKELAQQHDMREDDKEDVESKPEEEQKNWGSKVAKKFGLF